jgi:DNA-binding NtrC family response regulator
VALIAEDEWMILLQIADAFQAAGWTVHEADRPESALAILRAEPEVALLVTDIRFGEAMDGWQLAHEARRINPDIGVIYASANERLAEQMVLGSRFIGKPCVMDQLIDQAEQLMRR